MTLFSRGEQGGNVAETFYRVFVSSTYEDMKEERQAVFDALLKCNCFPVGMEHFPSSNWKSLDLIKKYIDQCDYFVMVSAGIYGSLVPDQGRKVSFVEWEYDYAQQVKMPCYSFVIEDLDKLRGDKLDKDNRKLLEGFHKRVKGDGRNVKLYTSADNLNASVLHAFQNAPRHSPVTGWVRAVEVSNSNELIGVWKLVASDNPEWNRSTIIKIFSAHEFIWLQVDSADNGRFICGHYDINALYGYGSETTICEIPRMTSFGSILGKPQEYEIVVHENVLTTSGQRSTGGQVKEEFRRLDLSDAFDVLDNL